MTDPPTDPHTASFASLDLQIRELTIMVYDLHRMMKEQIEGTWQIVSLIEDATAIWPPESDTDNTTILS